MWLALATITIAAAIGFSVLALAIQKTDNRKDEQDPRISSGPNEPGGIDHAGHQSPHLLFRLNRLDTIALGKIEADDVIPPAPRVADTQVNGYVVRPLLHVMVLQEERERPQAQFRELVGHKLT